jgi:hypothetical protein
VLTKSQRGGHAIVVEFNTENGKITTPRGIFDPNFGWLGMRRGFNSLDFNQVLHSVFIVSVITTSTVLDPPGLIQAFQLRRVAGAKPPDLAPLSR